MKLIYRQFGLLSLRLSLALLFAAFGGLAFTDMSIAKPAIVFDAKTGNVIYSEEPHRRWFPASTTKIMTAYLVFEALRDGRLTLEDQLVSTETSLKEPPSKIGLPVGATMSVDLGLDALIIKSANDVSVMFAEKIAGDVPSFARLMNAKARSLGMTGTNFVNPNGLHNPDHYSTAHDMARLSLAIIKNFPQHSERFTKFKMKIGKRQLTSYNSLLRRKFPGANGMKTGFVCASGYNIVGSAVRNGLHLVSVVFGARSLNDRHNRATALLEYGFSMHEWKSKFFNNTLSNLQVEDQGKVNIAGNMRPVVCKPRIVHRRKAKRTARLKKRKRRKRRR